MILLMHGNNWTGQDVSGWYASEKLDGWRCVWTGSAFISRHGNPFNVPRSFLEGMPGIALDGELWAGRGKTHNDVKRFLARGEWEKLQFCPWDIPQAGLRIETAQKRLFKLKLPSHCSPVAMRAIASTDAARAIMAEVVRQGGEGVMLRRPGTGYQTYRTDDLLKMKGNL